MLALRFLPRISRVRSLAWAGSEYSMRAMVHLGVFLGTFLGVFRLIGWACMPKAPRRAPDHALRPTPDQRLARGHIEHMARRGAVVLSRHAKFESQNRSKNVTTRAQVRYARAKFPPYC